MAGKKKAAMKKEHLNTSNVILQLYLKVISPPAYPI